MISGIVNILKKIKETYVLGEKNKSWRKKNSHNETILKSDIDLDRVHVGRHTYGDLNIYTFSSNQDLYIGDFCSIADDVVFLLAGNHATDTVSSFPFRNKLFNKNPESLSKGDIVVEDDVWIGKGAMILSGVHLGQGCIIAAGAIVTKDIPPYSIAAGIPAKVVKKRFNDDIVEMMNSINWKECDDTFLINNVNLLYEKIDNTNAKAIINNFPLKKGINV